MSAAKTQLSRDVVPHADGEGRSRLRMMPHNNETKNERAPEHKKVADYKRWSLLVKKIRSGDEQGMEELYRVFSAGIRFYLCRQLGPQELDDKVHDTFLIVVQAIRKGDLREPERLMGFVRTVARRQVAAHIDQLSQRRRTEEEVESGVPVLDTAQSAEDRVIHREQVEIMKEALQYITPRDREILIRFYLKEQSQHQICSDMGLSETQFRLLKSRAKARFGEIGRKKLAQKPLTRFLMRFSNGERH